MPRSKWVVKGLPPSFCAFLEAAGWEKAAVVDNADCQTSVSLFVGGWIATPHLIFYWCVIYIYILSFLFLISSCDIGKLWLVLHNNYTKKFGKFWFEVYNVPKLASSKLPNSCSKFGKFWFVVYNVPKLASSNSCSKLASSKLPNSCSKLGKFWFEVYNVPKLASSKLPNSCQKWLPYIPGIA